MARTVSAIAEPNIGLQTPKQKPIYKAVQSPSPPINQDHLVTVQVWPFWKMKGVGREAMRTKQPHSTADHSKAHTMGGAKQSPGNSTKDWHRVNELCSSTVVNNKGLWIQIFWEGNVGSARQSLATKLTPDRLIIQSMLLWLCYCDLNAYNSFCK